MLRVSLAWHIFSLEVRNTLSYRVDFWVHFMGAVLVELGMAYFLWQAIFNYRQVHAIGGYTFSGMMTYYLLAHFIGNLTKGKEMHFISSDIYDGSLSRYLIYPLAFVYYKLLGHVACGFMATVKLVVAVFVFMALFGVATDVALTPLALLWGIVTAWMATFLYFFLVACVELTAFWAEGVWSLSVMLKAVIRLLGGAIVPLSLFPVWSTDLLKALPFYYIIAFPVQTALGHIAPAEWLLGAGILGLWTGTLAALYTWVWQQGMRTYSGIGM